MFSDRLKQLRREKGLTQIQLATELNVASGTIAMWETGKREPNFAITMGIADFFSTSTDFLGSSVECVGGRFAENQP